MGLVLQRDTTSLLEGEGCLEATGGGWGWNGRGAWEGSRDSGLQGQERLAQAAEPVRAIGGLFVPLLVGDQGERGGAVEHGLG